MLARERRAPGLLALGVDVRALAVVEAHAAPLVRRLLGRVLAGPHDHAPVADGDALPGRRRHDEVPDAQVVLRRQALARRGRRPRAPRGAVGAGRRPRRRRRRRVGLLAVEEVPARARALDEPAAAAPRQAQLGHGLVHDLHVAPAQPQLEPQPGDDVREGRRGRRRRAQRLGAQRRRGGRGLHGHGLGVDGRAVPGRRRRRRGRRGGDGRPASAALIGRTGGRVAHRCPAVGVGRGAVPSSRRGLPDDVRVGPVRVLVRETDVAADDFGVRVSDERKMPARATGVRGEDARDWSWKYRSKTRF